VPNTQTATTSSGGVFLEERLPISRASRPSRRSSSPPTASRSIGFTRGIWPTCPRTSAPKFGTSGTGRLNPRTRAWTPDPSGAIPTRGMARRSFKQPGHRRAYRPGTVQASHCDRVCHTSHLPPERERSRRVLGLCKGVSSLPQCPSTLPLPPPPLALRNRLCSAPSRPDASVRTATTTAVGTSNPQNYSRFSRRSRQRNRQRSKTQRQSASPSCLRSSSPSCDPCWRICGDGRMTSSATANRSRCRRSFACQAQPKLGRVRATKSFLPRTSPALMTVAFHARTRSFQPSKSAQRAGHSAYSALAMRWTVPLPTPNCLASL
jgi:hypothetical protein